MFLLCLFLSPPHHPPLSLIYRHVSEGPHLLSCSCQIRGLKTPNKQGHVPFMVERDTDVWRVRGDVEKSLVHHGILLVMSKLLLIVGVLSLVRACTTCTKAKSLLQQPSSVPTCSLVHVNPTFFLSSFFNIPLSSCVKMISVYVFVCPSLCLGGVNDVHLVNVSFWLVS